MTDNKRTPNDKWSLDELGKFCVESDKRLALDAWMTGKALHLAKLRCKEEGQRFTDWKTKHGFSNAKVSRYVRLYKAFPTSKDQQRLAEVGIMEALCEAGIAKEATSCGNIAEQAVADDDSTAEATTCESESDHTERAAKESPQNTTERRLSHAKRANDHTSHSWAVEADGSDNDLPDTEEYLVDVWSRSETLEEQCRSAIPWQVRMLRQNVENLLGQDRESLRKAWSESETDRRQLADDVDALQRLLPELFATFPDDGGAALALAG